LVVPELVLVLLVLVLLLLGCWLWWLLVPQLIIDPASHPVH
jgi:hypothetical protein